MYLILASWRTFANNITKLFIVAYCNILIYGNVYIMVTDWKKIQNILLLQHGEICITVYGTIFIQKPLLQKHIKFRSNAVRCK